MLKLIKMLKIKKGDKEKENIKRKRNKKNNSKIIHKNFIIFLNEIDTLRQKNYNLSSEFKSDFYTIKVDNNKKK